MHWIGDFESVFSGAVSLENLGERAVSYPVSMFNNNVIFGKIPMKTLIRAGRAKK